MIYFVFFLLPGKRGELGKVWMLIFDYKVEPKYHLHHHSGEKVSSNGTIVTTARKIQTTEENLAIGAICKKHC